MRARAAVFVHLSCLCASGGGGGADVSLEKKPQSFSLKVDESPMRKEFVARMMLIVAVSMPNDVSGTTH